jgi:hypothetical protein
LIQPIEHAGGAPAGRAWLAPIAVIASSTACIAGALLSYALVARPLDRDPLLWVDTPASGPGDVALAVGSVLLAGAVLGVVLGVMALVLRHRRRPAAIAAVALGVASLLAVGAATAYAGHDAWTGSPHPSDARLIGTFNEHEAQFEQAIVAFKADGSVDADLLHSIGVEAEGVYREDGVIYLDASVYGLVTGGSSKGYAYSQNPLSTVPAGDLEGADTGQSEEGTAYKHITGPWYLFYEWD